MSWALPHVGEKIKDARYFSSAGHALVRMYVCTYVCAQEEELSQHKLGLPNLFFFCLFPLLLRPFRVWPSRAEDYKLTEQSF